MFYLALIIALGVTCLAGVQFFYLLFMQTEARQDKRRIKELERELKYACAELEATSRELAAAKQELETLQEHYQDEAWPEIID